MSHYLALLRKLAGSAPGAERRIPGVSGEAGAGLALSGVKR
jgi:hypothetical protein